MSCLDCGLASKAVEHAGLFLLPKITGIRFHPGNVSQSRFASASEESRLAGDETVWDPSQQTTPFRSGHNTTRWYHSSTHRHTISTDLWISLISQLKIIQKLPNKTNKTEDWHDAFRRDAVTEHLLRHKQQFWQDQIIFGCYSQIWPQYNIILNTLNKNMHIITYCNLIIYCPLV